MVSTATGAASLLIPGPSTGQVLGLCLGLACYLVAAGGAAWSLRSRQRPDRHPWVWGWMAAGVAGSAVLLLWRAEQIAWDWPFRHRFDTFILLAGLVSLVGLYVDLWWRWQLSGAAFAPLAAILQAIALTGLADYVPAGGPQPTGAAFLVHVIAFVLAAVCLAVAGVAGGFYLVLHRRLRRPGRVLPSGAWPSLEALERLNARAAALGFPLLTIGLWLGMAQIWHEPDRAAWLLDPKVAAATIVWLVYAILLHLQRLPTFRGTRVAWMSVLCTAGLMVVFVMADVGTKHP